MAALSYYSNWEALQHLNSDMSSILPPSELPPELLVGCMSDDNFAFPDVCSYNNIDYLFEPNDLFYLDENYVNSQLPNYLTPPTGLITTPSDHTNLTAILPDQPFLLQQEFELEPLPYPKRQKYDSNYQEFNNYYSDNYQFNPVLMNFQDSLPLPDFQSAPPVYSNGSCESSKKPSLSAQSIAARQRRRKITEKTQELGKLIPGSQRMNTAEMFHAAYKYIKFLQSQVGILEFMGSYHQENEDTFESEEHCGLLESSLVQEKLYSNEKCIVPKKLVDELSSDEEMFKAKPNVLEEIRQLVPTEEQYADIQRLIN